MMDIVNATLKTHVLQQMKQFYTDVLQAAVHSETLHSFALSLGKSTIVFSDEDVVGEPYYHFACDIPSNQFAQAKQWVMDRTDLLMENGKDEIDFSFSVATSLYFEDPAGNIVEFIARLNDNPASDEPFSMNSIQQLSEMSLVVRDSVDVASMLQAHRIVERSNEQVTNTSLAFIGDQQTSVYLLLTNPGRKWLFSPKQSRIFPIHIMLDRGIELGVNAEHAFYIDAK